MLGKIWVALLVVAAISYWSYALIEKNRCDAAGGVYARPLFSMSYQCL